MATLDGRYAIQLGDGCADVVEGVNVLVVTDSDSMTLQVVDPKRGVVGPPCVVADIVRTGETPCATNADGVRDYAYS